MYFAAMILVFPPGPIWLNPLNRYSLGTKSKPLHCTPDGSLTLYFGARSRGRDKDTKRAADPDGSLSLPIRCYWAKKAVLGGTWQPPQSVNVN